MRQFKACRKESGSLCASPAPSFADRQSTLATRCRQQRGLLFPHSSQPLSLKATASIDTATDGVLQKVFQHELRNRTTITVAHRLNTIIDSDLVIVLDKGQVLEMDAPGRLVSRDSSFLSLVRETGAQSSRHLTSLATMSGTLVRRPPVDVFEPQWEAEWDLQ